MNKKQKKNLIRILVSAGLMIFLHFVPASGWIRFVLYMIPYLLIGYDILWKAIKGIIHRQPFDECLLMAIATVGAMALAISENGDYTEAIAVMLFYQIGEWFQSYAVGKSRKNITDLMDIAPEYANIEQDGHLEQVDPDDVEIGSTIVVKTGEKIPIDGVVLDGKASLDTAALTGESLPRSVHQGDEVISGCINMDGVLKICTTKAFEDSTVAKVLELIEDASSHKSHSENFITKFARVYTPIVVYSAIALAFIPPLIQCLMHTQAQWGTFLYRALTFLVISCPCALVISIPLSFFAGIGAASHEGILVKGSNYLEILSEIKTVVFDKTGTLTKGVFEVTNIHPEKISADELLHMAAHVERYSTHPIANSLKKAYPNEDDDCVISDAKEIAGQGMQAMVNGKLVCVGNAKMMDAMGICWQDCKDAGTIIHIAIDGVYAGHIHISDVIKPHTKQAISELRKNGITDVVMLTGDSQKVAQRVAEEIGIQNVYSELLPQDKVKKVENLLQNKAKENDRLAFVGDGINDAPVLSRADIGVAMGAMGSDAAIEAADVVLMDDDPLKLATAIHISRKCLRIVKENIWFAIGVKVLCLILSAFGLANMWLAIFADVGVMILAVLNAMRCMFIHSIEPNS
ncbi:MAG: heavy metal translocating P-type ATPase [Absicoccus porci]|uniref:heavy metal translocating P-type ATPase n=1 Tax=Absicoccus porci TaxID=2486576 RepID=UPI0023545713|nr:heavy metal translocating P-type ATPase [Absicoccus porci]MCI6088092.1 cadmium-translocating P-type ATPase [Absicoccus porci]MDD7329726.1 heavy metal translocating P-type ATPase [Absicoccus porci]MDY4738339.1 heavy metal translocating P-type ATPase [Absicoccus porci]